VPPSTDPPSTRPDATVLVDGRHPAILLSVDAVARTARFDLVQFLTGAAADAAAAEDGKETPVPNGYYTRNVSDRLRTLPVAPDARITVNALAGAESGGKDVRYTLDQLASRIVAGQTHVFWLTVRANRIVRMEQQYVP
jgi:hypothetical protein